MVFTIHIGNFLYMALSQMLILSFEYRLPILRKHFQTSSKAFFVTMRYVLAHQVLLALNLSLGGLLINYQVLLTFSQRATAS